MNAALLVDLLNRRPAMNAGLIEAYAHWNAEVYRVMGALSTTAANEPTGECPPLPEPDTRWRAQFAGHGVSFHSEDQIIRFTNERVRAAVGADRTMRVAQPAGAQQPGAAYAALPDECDSPEICAISKTCAGQFGTKRICASHGQAPSRATLHQIMAAAKALHAIDTPDGEPAWETLRQCEVDVWRARAERVLKVAWSIPTARQAPAQAAPDVSGYVSEWSGGLCTSDEATDGIAKLYAAQPAGTQQPGVAYAELPSYEHQRAIMEAERNASLDEYSRIVPLTSTESMIYERAFTNGWNRHASHGQAPAQVQPAVDALAEAEYFIDNPSAWSNFDQRASDAIAAVCKAFRAARAPADSGAAPSQQVIVDFAQVGTAGPFAVVDGRVSLPDATMQDLVHMLRPTFNAQAADSVLEDAARWKMAVLVDNEVMMHPEKRTHPAAAKAYMDAVHSGLDLTGAIDAARKQGTKHD